MMLNLKNDTENSFHQNFVLFRLNEKNLQKLLQLNENACNQHKSTTKKN